MTEQYFLNLAKEEGFLPAMLAPCEIPVDAKFRAFCEQNLCGRYGANYSCPPDCGEPEELRKRLLAEQTILVVETVWDIDGYEDKEMIQKAKLAHNAGVLRLMEKLKQAGHAGICTGYNGCPLCDPCKRVENQPCAHPELRISCMSAYCIDVAELAMRCDLPFAWEKEKLYLFGLIAFHEAGAENEGG